MPPKPHRVLLDRVSGYADEAAAYMRRRRIQRKPFARLYYAEGRATELPADSTAGAELFVAAGAVIDLTRRSRLGGRSREA
ncbi:MAG TPA: hypothetical protein VMH33_05650 [Solirubrobacterales bacterium]|nr:hypothetical protein [Solirubrobacterales bacterium]